jgi:hypothetical protein
MKNKSLYLTVTQVLGPFSGLSGIDPEIVKSAGDRGTVVHRICDSIVLQFPFDDETIDQMIREYARNEEHFQKEKDLVLHFVVSFQKWQEGKVFLKKPERFFDDELMLTGECDLLYRDKEKRLVLVDLKTPASESKNWMLQGSAYSYLAKQVGHNIDVIEFVQLSRTGARPKIHHYKEDFRLFKAHLDVYKYQYKDWVEVSQMDYI